MTVKASYFLIVNAYLLVYQGNKAVLLIPRMTIVSVNELLAIMNWSQRWIRKEH